MFRQAAVARRACEAKENCSDKRLSAANLIPGSATNCFCPLSFHEETAIRDLGAVASEEGATEVVKGLANLIYAPAQVSIPG